MDTPVFSSLASGVGLYPRWTRLREGVTGNAVLCALAGMLLIAGALRGWRLGEGSLTHDEAWRVNAMREGGFDQRRWFPPGQMAISYALQSLGARSEWVLRLPSAVTGSLAVGGLGMLMLRRLGAGSALSATAFLTFHPEAVVYSRVVKEFSYEMLLTVCITLSSTSFLDQPTRGRWMAWVGISVAGLFFGFAPILIVAAWAPLVVIRALKDRPADGSLFKPVIVGSVILLALSLAWYVWLSGCEFRRATFYHFDQNEKAWPADYAPLELGAWLAWRTYELFRYACGVSAVWEPLATVLMTVYGLAAVMGGGLLWRRWRGLVVSSALLMVIAAAAGAARQWPYGAFRNNTYLTPLAAMFIGCGLAEMLRVMAVWPMRAVLAGLALILPAARAGAAIVRSRPNEHLRPVLEQVTAHLQPEDAVFVYYATDDAFAFYWREPRVETLVQPRSDRGRSDLFEARFTALLERHPRVWLLMTHPYADERDAWPAAAQRRAHLTHHFSTGTADVWCFQARIE